MVTNESDESPDNDYGALHLLFAAKHYARMFTLELLPLDNYGFPSEQTNRGPQRDEIRDAKYISIQDYFSAIISLIVI